MSQEDFNKALLAAQKEFPTVAKNRTAKIKTKTGSDYSYKYADLGDILDAVLPILHKHGIALSQPPIARDGRIGCTTRLLHTSGHVEECGEFLLPTGNTPQDAGSAMTYARRYAAQSALGIAADEDADGRQSDRPKPDEGGLVAPREWLAAQVAELTDWPKATQREHYKMAMAYLGYEQLDTQEKAEHVFNHMQSEYSRSQS